MDRDIARAARMRFLAGPGQPLSQAAYQFILSNPAATSIVGGFSEIKQIEEAAKASDLGALSAEELRRVDAAFREEAGALAR